jgi:hypothetical protein
LRLADRLLLVGRQIQEVRRDGMLGGAAMNFSSKYRVVAAGGKEKYPRRVLR